MKVEIAHDALAKRVYEKASSEDRMRLRVANLIKVKHEFFNEEKAYLTADELKLYAPFEKQIELTDAEKTFVGRSQILARKQAIGAFVLMVLTIFVLIFFLCWYVNSNDRIKTTNIELENEKSKLKNSNLELLHAKDSIQQLALSLIKKDSIEDILEGKIEDREQLLKMTHAELQKALIELKIANKKLEDSKRALEKECTRLASEKKDLANRLKKQSTAETVLSAAQKSQLLSQEAQLILKQNPSPSEEQYKEVFQLARAAWEMSNTNSQAMDILNKLAQEKLSNSNSGFLNNTKPRHTYTYKNIESFIQQLDTKYKYGKLPSSRIR